MPLPFVRLASFSHPLAFEELAQGLLQEVISADASLQVYQGLAWREVAGGSELLEGVDRLPNLGLTQVRFSFHLQPVATSWAARTWAVLTEPFGQAWLSRVAQRLLAPPRSFRIASGPKEGGLSLTVTIGREPGGGWRVRREPESLPGPLEH